MNKSIVKLSYYSALISASTFIIWIICFTGIALTSPLFFWTNLSDYQEFISSNSQIFQYLAKSFMLIFAISYLILLVGIAEFISDERKIFARIGLLFGLLFSLTISIHYFVQISAVRFAFNNSQIVGIEHFLQANPTSVMSSINMLGWTLFLGLSSLFMYVAFTKENFNKLIRVSLLVNGISCLLAGFGFLLQIDIITFVFINLGVGGALLIFTIALSIYLHKLK